MKTCWQILGIEATTQPDIIRQAYLALLPSFHPESDPQGFKQLRQAYEDAQRQAQQSDDDIVVDVEDEHDILTAFRALVASDRDRFQPSAWQRFIQQLNLCPIDEIDKLRWPLCEIAMNTRHISFNCLSLLAERLNWQPSQKNDVIDEEHQEAFLEAVKLGDCFDLFSIAEWSNAAQNQTISYFFELERIWRFHSEYLMTFLHQIHGTWVIPDDKQLHRKLLRWHSVLRCGGEELLKVAYEWRDAEPENEDAHYCLCVQRLCLQEGDSLLPDLCAFWQTWPSTHADDLLLHWCRQYRPDYFPLLVLVIEARSLVDADGVPLKYVPGESARTRLLWAEILHSGRLSPLGLSFVESLLCKRAAMSWSKTMLKELGEPETPLLDLYRTAEQVVLEAFPKQKAFYRLMIRLEASVASPLEALVTRSLLAKIPLKPCDLRDKKDLEEELLEVKNAPPEVEKSAPNVSTSNTMKVLKIIGFIALIVGALNRFFHFF